MLDTDAPPVASLRVHDLPSRRARAERILDAAAELLVRWGYKRVTVDDVACAAGIGKGTLYLHWKTRETLFAAVLLREAATVFDELAEAVRRDPCLARPHAFMRCYFLSVTRRPLMRAIFVADVEMLGNLARLLHNSPLAATRDCALGAYLELCRQHGLLRGDLPIHELAFAMRACAIGFFLSDPVLKLPGPTCSERVADLLADVFQRSFEGPATSPTSAEHVAPHVITLFTTLAAAARTHAATDLPT